MSSSLKGNRESHDPKLTVTVKKYLFRKVEATSLFTCTCPSCHLYQSRQRCDAPAVWGPLGLLCGPLWGLVGPLDGLRGPRVPTAPASLCARPDLKQAGGNRISWCSHCVLKSKRKGKRYLRTVNSDLDGALGAALLDEYNSIKHLDSKTHLCIFIGLSVKSTFDLDTKYGRAF